jgi:glutamate/aspartate transport system substrate-binding protein
MALIRIHFFPTGVMAMKKQWMVLALSALSVGAVWAQASDTVAKVKASGTVTMGVRDSSGALSYTLGDGKYAGYHVDVCHRILDNLEKAAGKKLDIKYLPVTSQNRIPLVQNGTVDIECGSTTNNATRQKDVAFALTTYVEEVRIAVKANSGITSINQLNGKNVVTTTGTTSVQHLRKHERANGVDFKEVFGKDHAESFLLLEAGRADAFVMDGQILAGNIALAKNPADFKIVGEVLSVEPIAIMLRKDDPAFKKLADDTIRDLAKSGELAKIYDKWFVQPIPPKNTRVGLPASDTTKAAWATPNDKPMEEYAKK